MVVRFQVYKKTAPNSKVTLYLTKRDFYDRGSNTDDIEGILLVDPSGVGVQTAFVQLVVTFRYGNEGDESMGYNLEKTMYLETTPVYPPEKDIIITEVQFIFSIDANSRNCGFQRNLISKLGNFAFPFRLTMPKLASVSCQMIQGWEDEGSRMGLEYQVMAFVGDTETDLHNRSMTSLLIRRLQEVNPSILSEPTPHGILTKTFMTCSGNITIEGSIARNVFHQDDDIPIKLSISNNTTREIKRLKVKVIQISEIPMFSDTQKRIQTLIKHDEALGLRPGVSTTKEYSLVAIVPPRQARGTVFLQGALRPDATPILAGTTIVRSDIQKRDIFGVVVSYAVRIKVTLGALFGDAILDLPFVLDSTLFLSQRTIDQ